MTFQSRATFSSDVPTSSEHPQAGHPICCLPWVHALAISASRRWSDLQLSPYQSSQSQPSQPQPSFVPPRTAPMHLLKVPSASRILARLLSSCLLLAAGLAASHAKIHSCVRTSPYCWAWNVGKRRWYRGHAAATQCVCWIVKRRSGRHYCCCWMFQYPPCFGRRVWARAHWAQRLRCWVETTSWDDRRRPFLRSRH